MAVTNYRPDIDGLRAVAVLAVVMHHLSATLVPGGYIGVDVFFVISGYLITRIISREMEEGTFTFSRFYERRARRIFPALFAVLAVTLVAGYFLLLPSDYSGALRGALGTLFFASNIVFWRDMAAGYFAATDAGLNPLLHTWSLAVEEQFYVFFPVLLLVCYRYFRRHMILILIGCAVVSLAGAALLVHSKSVAVFFLSPFRAWELLVGSLLAFNAVPPIRSRAVREVIAGAGLLTILIACFVYDPRTTFPGFAALAPVMGAAAIMHAGASGLSITGRLLQWPPMVYIGLISYSFYLWHWPLIVLVQYANGIETSYLPVLFVASLLLGSLSYRFIEQPFRYNRRLVTSQVVFSFTGIFASLLIIVTVAGLVKNGFSERFDSTVVKLDKLGNYSAQVIPYKSCESRAPQVWCVVGSLDGEPHTLVWGDSHALAWGPVIHEVILKKNERAIFAPSVRCPPLFGVGSRTKPECAASNLAIKNHLLSHEEIKTVIMSARWLDYFNEDSALTESVGGPGHKGIAVASYALASTLEWLQDHGRNVIIIGPVPEYERSVPQALALELATGRQILKNRSASEQRHRNMPFLTALENVRPGLFFNFFDPVQWLCADGCKVIKDDGVPFYRDSNHLSVAGAMSLEADFASGLILASAGLATATPIKVTVKK